VLVVGAGAGLLGDRLLMLLLLLRYLLLLLLRLVVAMVSTCDTNKRQTRTHAL
jgi:hypothetical protein